MEEYEVVIEKKVIVTVLNEKELLKMYRDTVDPDSDIDDAVEYVARCIVDDMTFAGLVHIEKDNGVFDWNYNRSDDESYIN